jgi:hypothetical protein
MSHGLNEWKGHDCGVYVMAITELLCQRLEDMFIDKAALSLAIPPGDLSLWKCSRLLTPDLITQKRYEVRELMLLSHRAINDLKSFIPQYQ